MGCSARGLERQGLLAVVGTYDGVVTTTTSLRPRPDATATRPAGGAPRLLRRRRPRGDHRGEGARPVRTSGLRPQADRPQQARRRDPRVARARCSSTRPTRCPRARSWCSPPTASRRRSTRRPLPRGLRDHRRDLPAGHQGAPRGEAVRRRGLPDPAHRPRGPRGGRRDHAARRPSTSPWSTGPAARTRSTSPDPDAGGLAVADDAVGRRDRRRRSTRSARRLPRAARPAQRRHLLRHAEPPGRGQGIAADCDLVIVVGSANSSNSVRLVEVALEAGARAALPRRRRGGDRATRGSRGSRPSASPAARPCPRSWCAACSTAGRARASATSQEVRVGGGEPALRAAARAAPRPAARRGRA